MIAKVEPLTPARALRGPFDYALAGGFGKVIGGVIRPDEGQLFVDDRPVRYASPREARIDGIEIGRAHV